MPLDTHKHAHALGKVDEMTPLHADLETERF